MNGDLRKAALVPVDLQNAFCSAGGTMSKMGMDERAMRPAVLNAARLLSGWREHGQPVVHVRHAYRADYADGGLLISEKRPQIREFQGLIDGTWDAAIVDELTPDPGELVVTKHRFSGFYQTDLELLLRGLGADTLVFAGIATNVCVESTARDAAFRDFRVVIAGDACAARDPALHAASLKTLNASFGSTALVDEILGAMGHLAGASAEAPRT